MAAAASAELTRHKLKSGVSSSTSVVLLWLFNFGACLFIFNLFVTTSYLSTQPPHDDAGQTQQPPPPSGFYLAAGSGHDNLELAQPRVEVDFLEISYAKAASYGIKDHSALPSHTASTSSTVHQSIDEESLLKSNSSNNSNNNENQLPQSSSEGNQDSDTSDKPQSSRSSEVILSSDNESDEDSSMMSQLPTTPSAVFLRYKFKPPYLLINRHYGLSKDIHHALEHYKIDRVDEKSHEILFSQLEGITDVDFLTEQEADLPAVQRLAGEICSQYEFVLVADVNGDGRFLLQWIEKNPFACAIKRLVFLSTNRFDFHTRWFNGDNEPENSYLELVKRVMIKYSENEIGTEIIWVANNPYEIKYAEMKLGIQIHVNDMKY